MERVGSVVSEGEALGLSKHGTTALKVGDYVFLPSSAALFPDRLVAIH